MLGVPVLVHWVNVTVLAWYMRIIGVSTMIVLISHHYDGVHVVEL